MQLHRKQHVRSFHGLKIVHRHGNHGSHISHQRYNPVSYTHLLEGYRDEKAWIAGSAERAFVKYLNGGCSSPVAAFGVVEGDELFLRGLYYRECDGRYFKDSIRGPKSEAEKLGRDLAKRMQDMYDLSLIHI